MKTTQDDRELIRAAMLGKAASLLGMQQILEEMQRHVDGVRVEIADMQALLAEPPTKKLRKQPPSANTSGRGKYGWGGLNAEERSAEMQRRIVNRKKKNKKSVWDGMSAEERSAEMKRRRAVAKQNQVAALNPRDKNHPDHAEWVEKVGKIHRARWAKKTKAQKEAWKAKMAAGKTAAGKTAKLPLAS